MSDRDEAVSEMVGDVVAPDDCSGPKAVVVKDELSGEVRRVIEQAIREVLPSFASQFVTRKADGEQIEGDDVFEILQELKSTRKQLEKLQSEKASQDREIFLKDQMSSLGVRNVDLAYRAVREEVYKGDDGEWVALINGESVPAIQFLRKFVNRNPELIPARMISGAGTPSRAEEFRDECDLDQIRPGMDPASMRRAKEAVVRIIAQTKRVI